VLLTPNDRASKHALHSTLQHYRSPTIERARERALTLVPCVLETRVFPTFLTLNTDGALISYQSFLLKGSTLQENNKRRHETRNGSAPDLRAREGSEGAPDLREEEKRAGATKLTSSSCLLSSPWRCACSCRPPYLLAAGDAACCAREMESERISFPGVERLST
jgi:hypothetical protein